MNRLTFEEDDVIREALKMETDSEDDCNLVNRGQNIISSKENTKESTVQQSENKKVLTHNNGDEEFIKIEMEEIQNPEDEQQSPNCLQEFKKKKLQNHDSAKKKRKSLVLSFHTNLSITSSLNSKSVHKIDNKNDKGKSDKRKSIDESILLSFSSDSNGKTNYKKSPKYDKNYHLDIKEQNFEIKKSKTPIFYECPTCFHHFTKKEIDIHKCRDNSCLTLKFSSSSSSFNNSVGKHDKKDFSKTNPKTPKQKAIKNDNRTSLSTELKQPIKSQHFENDKLLKQNQSIALKKDNKRKKIMRRKYSASEEDTEKEVCEPKTKKIKIDQLNNELNKSINSNLEIDSNKITLRSGKQIVKSSTEKNIKVKESNKLPKQDKISSQSTHKMCKRDEKSSEIVDKNVISKKHEICRINEGKVLLEKGKDTGCQNLVNKKAEVVTRSEQNEGTVLLEKEKEDTGCQNLVNKKVEVVTRNEQNEGKVLLEKEKQDTGCKNLVNRKAEVVTRKKQDVNTKNVDKQNKTEGNRNFENVQANLTLNQKQMSNKQEKSIKIKPQTGIIKKTKRPVLQNKYKCRLCSAKYTKTKHHNHICKYKVRKTKFKRKERQILKKSDCVLKNCKNNSQDKINITILSRDNVKIVTVSNNGKAYEVKQGDISNYVQSQQISKQKETVEQKQKSSTETVSQSDPSNISEGKTCEKEKVTFDVTGKSEPIISQHKNTNEQNTDLNEFSKCEGNSKIQENNALFVESQKQNNKNDNEKQLTKSLNNNTIPTEIGKTIPSQNADYSYTITDVGNNQSINTPVSENTMSTQDVDHSYSVSEANMISTYKKDDINTKIILLSEEQNIEKSIHSIQNDVIASIDDVETNITVPEIVGTEITILESKTTTSEEKNILPENVGKDVIIPTSEERGTKQSEIELECEIILPENVEIIVPEKVGNEITILPENVEIMIPEIVGNEIVISECQVSERTRNENTTSTQNMNIEHCQIEIIGCEAVISNDHVKNEVIIAAQNEVIDNNQLMLKDSIVSINDVAQEIIIAFEEEIIHKENEIVPANVENHAASDTQIGLLSIDNVEQEVITDEVSIENVRNVINADKNVDHTVTDKKLGNEIIITTEIQGNDNIASSPIKDHIYDFSGIPGFVKKRHKNREINTKTSAEHLEHHTRNEAIEKVSVERLENEVFVSNYVAEKDLIKNGQTEAYVSTTNFNVETIKDVQTNETYISKQYETDVATLTKTKNIESQNVSTKIIAPSDSIKDTNTSIQNNGSKDIIRNTIVKERIANRQLTVNIDEGKNVLIQDELEKSTEIEDGILTCQSYQSDKSIPANDEIETIIIISSEHENKKNIILTQNENNETVIIISKQKEISDDHDTVPSRVKEIGNQNNTLSLIENNDINSKNNSELSKTFTEDELKTNDCTNSANISVKEKVDSLSIEIELAPILNQTDSQNKVLDTKRISTSSETHKCNEKNIEKEENTLESQLAAILNQNESQNRMAVKQDSISSANSIGNDSLTYKHIGSPITNNQLLDILSTNVDDISQVQNSNHDSAQKENSNKAKCFRCFKEFINKELTTHNCLKQSLETDDSDKIATITKEVEKSKQSGEAAENNLSYVIEIEENSESARKICTDHKIPKTKCIRCFVCSKIYDKTHNCSNIEKETESNIISLEKSLKNSQDARKPKDRTVMKKNKYYFNRYVLRTTEGEYQCTICNKKYTARKNLVRHIHKHEKDYDKDKFKCNFCIKTFEYKASLKSHEACHTGQSYNCPICDKTFSRKTNWYTHMKLHGDIEAFHCDKCGKEYTRKKYFNNHPCFNNKEFYCEHCDKKYRHKSNLIDHLHTHAESKPYKCKFCNKKFAFRSSHFTHKQNCVVAKQHKGNTRKNQEKTIKNNQFTCKICSITLQNEIQLKKHEWRHENKHFFCDICSKKFKSKHFLQLHLASHIESGVTRKKFDCPQCDKQFSTNFGLKLHLNKHNGVTFSCPLCEKLFSTKLLLRTHEKTHTGETPFVCLNCDKAFNNRSNYNRHKKNMVCYFTPIETN